jgi:hypothetical protein
MVWPRSVSACPVLSWQLTHLIARPWTTRLILQNVAKQKPSRFLFLSALPMTVISIYLWYSMFQAWPLQRLGAALRVFELALSTDRHHYQPVDTMLWWNLGNLHTQWYLVIHGAQGTDAMGLDVGSYFIGGIFVLDLISEQCRGSSLTASSWYRSGNLGTVVSIGTGDSS